MPIFYSLIKRNSFHHFAFIFLFFVVLSQRSVAQQYTADFASAPTLIAGPYWIDTAQVTLGGQVYQIISGGNGGWAYKNSGGSGNGPNIQYDCAATTTVQIIRKDNKRFGFYGVWLKYADITTGLYNTPPYVSVSYTGSTDPNETYSPNTTTVISKNVSVTRVTINIVGLTQLNFDDLIVGPSPVILPVVTTSSVTSFGTTSATLGGNVTDDGAGTITERGVVYNTTGSPTGSDTKVTIGTGAGSFSQLVTGLSVGTRYYIKSYAVNSAGTSYGSEINFITDSLFVLQSTHNFNSASWGSTSNQPSPYTKLIRGWNVTSASTGVGNATISRVTGSNSADNGAAIRAQCATTTENLSYMSFKVSDSTHFDLQNFKFRYSTRTTGTSFSTIIVTGYVNGLPVSGAIASLTGIAPVSASTAYNTFDLSAISQFRDVDEFRITVADPVNSGRLLSIDLDLLTVKNVSSVSSNSALSGVDLSTGSLTPAFDSTTTSYSTTVSNSVSDFTVTPAAADSLAIVKVNGQIVTRGNASNPLSLSVGDNLVTIEVTAPDGRAVRSYTVVVTREASTNAELAGIIPAAGTISPAFDSAVTSYSATVANTVTTFSLTPSVFDTTATIRVNGHIVANDSLSQLVDLVVGDNLITVEVTAQDGSTVKSYTVTVTRAASTNAALSGINLSGGTLTPAFDSSITSYSVMVGNLDTTFFVIPYVFDTTTTIRVNGQLVPHDSLSQYIDLSVGDNLVTIEVTAQDGTTVSTYSVIVMREGSANVILDSVMLSAGVLTPAFDTAVTSYIVDIDSTTTAFSLTLSLEDTTATIRVNGNLVTSGTPSEPIDLSIGDNLITVEITSQNGTVVRTYTINARRAGTVLPVTLVSFDAYQKANAIEVSWETYNQVNIDRYIIEKSVDGIHFTRVGEVASRNNSSGYIYTWQDKNPFDGNNFYRLRSTDINGAISYSAIIKISINEKRQFVKIFPNPVKDKLLNLQLSNMRPGKYDLLLYNSHGQSVFSSSITSGDGSAGKSIHLPGNLNKGMYYLELKNGQDRLVRSVIIE